MFKKAIFSIHLELVPLSELQFNMMMLVTIKYNLEILGTL